MAGVLKGKAVHLFIGLVLLCTAAFGQITAFDWGEKGANLFGQGKYDEALQAFDKAIEINPQLAGAWTGKGYALIALGKYDEAVQAFDKAIEINPNDANALDDKNNALEAKELAATSSTATTSVGSTSVGSTDVNSIRMFGYIIANGSDKPINGAQVTVTDTAGNNLTAITDINGYYTLTLLKDALYIGDISADGYLPLPTMTGFSSNQNTEKVIGPFIMRLTPS